MKADQFVCDMQINDYLLEGGIAQASDFLVHIKSAFSIVKKVRD